MTEKINQFLQFLRSKNRFVIPWLIKMNIHPHHISWFGLVMALVAGLLAWKGWLLLAGVFSFLSGWADSLDGDLARTTNQSSPQGTILDSSLDRYADFFLLAGLAAFYSKRFFLNFALSLLALMGSYMVSYAQAKDEIMKTNTPAGTMKRPMRWAILVTALLLAGASHNQIPLFLALLSIAVFANYSAVKRLVLIGSKH